MTEDPEWRGHVIPREPESYRPTTHFLQRKHYRHDPHITGAVVAELFAEGRIERSDYHHVDNAFVFRKDIDGHDWRLVVGLMPEAFERDDAKHRVLTCYTDNHRDSDREARGEVVRQ